MTTDAEWEFKVKQLLKAELKRRNVTYQQLVDRLGEIGIKETEENFRNKLARGKFTAVFLLQCLVALGASSWRLSDAVSSPGYPGDPRQHEVSKQIARSLRRIEAALKKDRRRFGRR